MRWYICHTCMSQLKMTNELAFNGSDPNKKLYTVLNMSYFCNGFTFMSSHVLLPPSDASLQIFQLLVIYNSNRKSFLCIWVIFDFKNSIWVIFDFENMYFFDFLVVESEVTSEYSDKSGKSSDVDQQVDVEVAKDDGK